MSDRKIVIVGTGQFAEIALEYCDAFTDYEVVGFAVERAYLDRLQWHDRPVVAFEELETHFDTATHDILVAVVFTQLNRLRSRLVAEASAKGFRLARFVSDQAFIAPSARVGAHCFIFERNVIQSQVEIGDNVVLWSGNHIGHHARIEDNVFVSSHVVVSGSCHIGRNSFLGVNAAIGDGVRIGEDCWVGPGAVVLNDLPDRQIIRAAKSELARVDTHRFFRLKA